MVIKNKKNDKQVEKGQIPHQQDRKCIEISLDNVQTDVR